MQYVQKIKTLDGLRGFAVLLILIYHLPVVENFELLTKVSDYFRFGYFGVDIFFVLSGFLITRNLLAEKIHGQMSFSRFYLRRALRIFPAYYLCVIIVGLTVSWDDMMPVIFYYSNYYFAFHKTHPPVQHTWSLAVEEHFYLVWPVIIYGLSVAKSEMMVKFFFPTLAIVSAILTLYFVAEDYWHRLLYRGTTYRILSLSLGALLAYKEDRLKLIDRRWLFAIPLISFALFKTGVALSLQFLAVPAHMFFMVFFTSVSSLVFIFCYIVEGKDNLIRYTFTNEVIRFIGKISYGLYLWHLPIYYGIGVLYSESIFTLPQMLFAVGLSIFVATLSYYLVERPILRYRNRPKTVPFADQPAITSQESDSRYP